MRSDRNRPEYSVRFRPPEADTLRDLARRIERLLPDRHDPERFHIEKDEIAHELRRLAGRAGM